MRKMGGASGKVQPKSMEVERPSTRVDVAGRGRRGWRSRRPGRRRGGLCCWREMDRSASSCWMVSAKFCEESMGAKRTKAMWAAMRKTAEVRAMVVVAARWRRCGRRSQAVAGPTAKA